VIAAAVFWRQAFETRRAGEVVGFDLRRAIQNVCGRRLDALEVCLGTEPWIVRAAGSQQIEFGNLDVVASDFDVFVVSQGQGNRVAQGQRLLLSAVNADAA
jgi:hypothetical protein